jgi:hypothetical protein
LLQKLSYAISCNFADSFKEIGILFCEQGGKTALADDVLPNGTVVKIGTLVSYSQYCMGQLEKVWGPDAKSFKPERWLKDGIFQSESPFKFIAFNVSSTWLHSSEDSKFL